MIELTELFIFLDIESFSTILFCNEFMYLKLSKSLKIALPIFYINPLKLF